MKKTLFRTSDCIELSIVYLSCFILNIIIEYTKTLEINSYILENFIKIFTEHQTLITILFTFVVIIFHYQMLQRKKEEIFCKILVGDTISNIITKYILDCLYILITIFLLSTIVSAYFNYNLINNIYLFLTFIIYIFISTIGVKKYENF